MSKHTRAFEHELDKGAFIVGRVPRSELMRNAKMAESGQPTVMEEETLKTLRNGAQKVDEAYAVFDAAFCKMAKREAEVEAATKKHVAILKDKANQVAEALARIEKMTGPDFEVKLQRLERLAAAVDALDGLNSRGKLAGIMSAITAA